MARKTAEPKPWQRVERGRYRSSDERFTLDQGDPGRWFLIDEVERDELGLARTLGPFATLDEAKARADELRSGPVTASPLADRLAEAAKRPEPKVEPESRPRPEPKAAEPPPPPRPPTWLDRLPSDEASHARRLIAALTRLGFEDAEDVVRRDVETGAPEVAAALLRRLVERKAVEPWSSAEGLARLAHDRPDLVEALAAARRAGLSDEAVGSLARAVGSAAAVAALSAVSGFDRLPNSDPALPGWELLERAAGAGSPAATERRRLRLDG